MPSSEVSISISSNNSELESTFLHYELNSKIRFVKENKSKTHYRIFLIDLSRDLTHISQALINTYNICREKETKLAVVILHQENIDIEKNHYFQKMLSDLGKDTPLHRLILTKDLYQIKSTSPQTPLDMHLHEAVSERKIEISQKGENHYFPLSLDDLISGLIKTLFLSNTSGKAFWFLGDPITDLELSYLLKKYISTIDKDDLEINATKINDQESKSNLSTGNITRADLNWQPENDFVSDLKVIVGNYLDSPPDIKTVSVKLNPLYRFLTWVYKPRQKKETGLPTFKKIFSKLVVIVSAVYLLFGVVFAIFTTLSLQQLEKAVNNALSGNLKASVSSLEKTTKYKEMGESSFSPLTPIANLISPKGTEKIFNMFLFIDYSATSLSNLHQTYVIAENLLLSINNDKEDINYENLSLALHSNLSQVYENISQLSFLGNEGKLPGFIGTKLKANPEYENLKTLEDQIVQFIKITDIIPSILPKDKVINILVLLQNSQVLMPNGGSIDYYLLLSLDHGKLMSKKYFESSVLEKQFLDFLRDSKLTSTKNTDTQLTLQDYAQDPNFYKASSELSVALEKILNVKPDFVLATNDLLIKQLLIEEDSQILEQFKTDLKSILGAEKHKELFDQYLDKLLNQNLSLPVVGRAVAKMVGDNQILLWSADESTERLISSQSYSGVIASHLCNAGIIFVEKCISETSYLSEYTNTQTRQRIWSDRQLSHTITINDTSIQHEYLIEYKAKLLEASSSSAVITYHLYFPSPSTLDQILLNDLPVSMKLINKQKEGQFDHYSIPVPINFDTDNQVDFKSTSTSGYPNLTPLSYSITEYRQPGTTDPGIVLKINYPENLKPTVVTSAFTADPMQIKLILPPHTTNFGVTFTKN